MRLVFRAVLERVLIAPRLRAADAQVAVEGGAVDGGRGEVECVLKEHTRLLVLLLALELLYAPLAFNVFAEHALDLLHQLRELLGLLIFLFALLMLWVEFERLAEVAQGQLSVAHDVKLLAALVQLAERVVR